MPRDEQRRDLEPHARLAFQVDERVEHRLQVPQAQLPVEVLGEALQVDVRGVHEPVHLRARLRADVAGRHRHGPQAARAAGAGHVHRVLQEDHRVVVGEGDAAAAQVERRLGDLLGACGVAQPIDLARLRDVPVLAEAASQVAPGGAEGEHRRAGQEVVERLLLDRIHAESARAAVGGEHDPLAFAGADEAHAALAVVQSAVPRADLAADAAVGQRAEVAPGEAHMTSRSAKAP